MILNCAISQNAKAYKLVSSNDHVYSQMYIGLYHSVMITAMDKKLLASMYCRDVITNKLAECRTIIACPASDILNSANIEKKRNNN